MGDAGVGAWRLLRGRLARRQEGAKQGKSGDAFLFYNKVLVARAADDFFLNKALVAPVADDFFATRLLFLQ